eukprot:CAMPEP_0185267578 /NCGR_PEP_ID=MMETSP1359-20130426/34750_1 /TAXON_ID=552665 /ORGANISM="Bigelowiella longifila, Strain CCMP242" /LENGTH=327 /DNA_ID=CAMNT_0027857985 /DNA_START=10 /DNA_END=993 /DNA_ORIENTATION=+
MTSLKQRFSFTSPGLFSIVVALSLLHNCSASTLPSKFTPAVFWSGTKLFSGHETLATPVDAYKLEEYARDVLTSKSKSLMLHPEEVSERTPEVFVSFTFERASYDDLASFFGFYGAKASVLRKLVKKSTSSLSFPRVSLDNKQQSFSSMFSPHLPPKSKRVMLETDTSKKGCDTVLAKIQGDNHLVSNDRTDFISVTFTEAGQEQNEVCLERIVSMISKKTNNNYACMFAAEDTNALQMEFPTTKPKLSHHAARASLHSVRVQSLASTSTQAEAGTGLIEYISPVIFIGIIFSLMLIFFIFVGVMAMFSVVVPMRFEKAKFKLGKIY